MEQTPDLSFVDGPRSELDRALAEVVARASDVMMTQGRLRALLRATSSVVQQLELPVVLRTIVEAATELVDAEYAALGVISPEGDLEQFIHVGMAPEIAARIGHLPRGKGLLGALIDDPKPIRLDRMGDDARSVGFPAEHPPMEGFLGVPVRVRGTVYGNLYLANPRSGSFSSDDEQLIASLARAAGFAIDNARLYELTRLRERWSSRLATLTAELLRSDPQHGLPLVLSAVKELTGAAWACLVVPSSGTELRVVLSATENEHDVAGSVFPAGDSISGRVITTGEAVAHRGGGDAPLFPGGGEDGPRMAVPLTDPSGTAGALFTARPSGGTPFSRAELERASEFVAQASLAIEVSRRREDEQRMLLLEDKGRIARDMHDHVIQQLFATGLELQMTTTIAKDPEVQRRLERGISGIDLAIGQIRTAIFALTVPDGEQRASVRHTVIDLVDRVGSTMTVQPSLLLRGPLDESISGDLEGDLTAVIGELLSNIARHAAASESSIVVEVSNGQLAVTVSDDGPGIGPTSRRSGLDNLRIRAERRGGSCVVASDQTGTTVTWTAPLHHVSEEIA